MSYILGLTGPTGAGKGVFSSLARKMGFNIIDCDKVARQSTAKGSPALFALTEAFGQEVLLEDGELDRKKLASIAFSSKKNTELLNKTVLPFICSDVKKQISGDFVVLDAPTLFESGIDGICDTTAAVLAPKALRRQRIIERDELTYTEADTRISAGKNDEFYISRAKKIFINDGDADKFLKKVKIYLNNIIGGNNNERI